MVFFWFFCALCTDELLKRNLLLNRYALDNRRETLGKKQTRRKKLGGGDKKERWSRANCIFFIFFFAVIDTKIEEIAPTLNAATLDESTELRFTVPASADYFTR